MKIILINIVAFICLCSTTWAQNGMVLKDNVFVVMRNAANIVIANPNSNAITEIATGGNIISEGEDNVIKWKIATNTGTYTIPFTTNSGVKIPLEMNITSAGSGSGDFLFSSYETSTDMNVTWPTGVTNMNDIGGSDNSLFVVDRFWKTEGINYTSKPTAALSFGYDDSPNEIGGTNTINESNLQAQCYDGTSNSWDITLFGSANTVSNLVDGVNVGAGNFHSIWTLSDNVSPLPVSLIDFKVECINGNFNRLQWETLSELNNAYFTIENSFDGVQWNKIKEIQGAGTSNLPRQYTFTDEEKYSVKAVFYRLGQTDFYGQSKYLSSESANCGSKIEFPINLYPNPNNGIFYFLSNPGFPQNAEIQIFNAVGEMVYNTFLQENSTINLENQPNGVYLVKVFWSGQMKACKMVKQ